MRTVLKWIGIILAVVVVIAIVVMTWIFITTESRITKLYNVKPAVFDIPDQPDLQGRNYPLVMLEMCKECHGQDFSGQVMEDSPLIGRLVSSNLTSGEGGIGSLFKDEDWARAIRNGINPDGKSLIGMPSADLNYLSDEDLGIIVSTIKNSPSIDKTQPRTMLGPMGRVLLLQGLPILAAEQVEGSPERPAPPPPGNTLEYGQYMATFCQLCHGKDLSGTDVPGGGVNITPGGDLASWTEADFIKAMRTGLKPDGKMLDQELMPARIIGKLNEDELKTLWMYLKSVPPVASPTATPGN
jgi:cytochrome c553